MLAETGIQYAALARINR